MSDFDDELFVSQGPSTFQSDLSNDKDVSDPLALNCRVTRSKSRNKLRSIARSENGSAEDVTARPLRRRPRLVHIEVQLPWLSPARRASYKKVKVEDYHPGEDEPRTRRRRRVSHDACIRDDGFLLCFGSGPVRRLVIEGIACKQHKESQEPTFRRTMPRLSKECRMVWP